LPSFSSVSLLVSHAACLLMDPPKMTTPQTPIGLPLPLKGEPKEDCPFFCDRRRTFCPRHVLLFTLFFFFVLILVCVKLEAQEYFPGLLRKNTHQVIRLLPRRPPPPPTPHPFLSRNFPLSLIERRCGHGFPLPPPDIAPPTRTISTDVLRAHS